MPGIFEPSNLPAWMNPTRAIMEEDANAVGAQFGAGFRSGQGIQAEEKLTRMKIRAAQGLPIDDKSLANDKKGITAPTSASSPEGQVGAMVGELQGVKTPEEAWDRVSKHPEWLVNPATAVPLQRYLKAQTDVARAEVNSIQGKTKIADVTNFTKRLSALPDPADRSAIQGMRPNPDGGISPDQWQALANAESIAKVHSENERKQAEIDALQRGDVPTTTVNEKGVSTTFKPTATAKTYQPAPSITLEDGTKLINLGPNRWQHEKEEFSTQRVLDIANAALKADPDNAQAKNIISNLTQQATSRLNSRTNAPANPNRVLKYNPVTGRLE